MSALDIFLAIPVDVILGGVVIIIVGVALLRTRSADKRIGR